MTNDDLSTAPKGFTRYVQKQSFDKFCDKVEITFHGKEGRNGLVGDVNYIKHQINLLKWFVGISVGIVSPLITAFVIKYFL